MITKTIYKNKNNNKNKSKSKKFLYLTKAKYKNYKLNHNQTEFILLLNVLLVYIINMKILGLNNNKISKRTINLLKKIKNNNKFIRKNINVKEIIKFANSLNTYANYILKDIETIKKNKKQEGGFFFKDIEDKAEQPITGADVSKLLDDIQSFFYNAQYTAEGQFLTDTNTVLSMLRGDTSQFKGLLQYRIFPKYYTTYPPFIKWDGIKEAWDTKKWEDLPDYLIAYQTYLRLQDEYLVRKGLKAPSVLSGDLYTGFYNKLANSLNDNIYTFQTARRYSEGTFFPISLPI